MEFSTELRLNGKTATGIRVPDEVMVEFGGAKRVPVTVVINGVSYPSTVAMMAGEPLIPVSAEIRAKADISAGDTITVGLERDDSPRTVDVPPDLQKALDDSPTAAQKFAALSYSNRRRHTLAVTGARTDETRQRRIDKIVRELAEG